MTAHLKFAALAAQLNTAFVEREDEIRARAEFEDETALRGRLRAVDAKTEVARA